MLFENYYINFNSDLNINSIYSYRIIQSNFINKYIKHFSHLNKDINDIYLDALTYSKYYIYNKIYNCIYSDEIMQIIYDIEFMN